VLKKRSQRGWERRRRRRRHDRQRRLPAVPDVWPPRRHNEGAQRM